MCYAGAASLPGALSPGWNGWCRQRLNPAWAHCVMSTSTTFLLEIPRAQQLATGSGKVRQLAVLLNHRRRVWTWWISPFLSSNSLLQHCNCLMLFWNTWSNSDSSRTKGERETAPLLYLACGLVSDAMLTHLIRPTISPGNIYCRFCLHILPLNNSPFLSYIWLTFINVIDYSPAFMGMRSDLF